MEKYLISTNVDGHLYCDYTTEKLMNLKEAKKKLVYIRKVDPNAILVQVVKVDERRKKFGDNYKSRTSRGKTRSLCNEKDSHIERKN